MGNIKHKNSVQTIIHYNVSLWQPRKLLKGIVHQKMKILSLFSQPHVVPNMYEFLFSDELP